MTDSFLRNKSSVDATFQIAYNVLKTLKADLQNDLTLREYISSVFQRAGLILDNNNEAGHHPAPDVDAEEDNTHDTRQGIGECYND